MAEVAVALAFLAVVYVLSKGCVAERFFGACWDLLLLVPLVVVFGVFGVFCFVLLVAVVVVMVVGRLLGNSR